jgi:hypothetical protein
MFATPRAVVTATRRVKAEEPIDPAVALKDSHEEKISRSAAAQITNGFALLCICIIAFSVRLFSVIKYESVIHEFDPYFNYRVTQFLTKEGFYNLWNWFDTFTWYPLGRVVGGTVYPVSCPGPIWSSSDQCHPTCADESVLGCIVTNFIGICCVASTHAPHVLWMLLCWDRPGQIV